MDAGFDLQFLKRGKALCSAAFPNLCATWNWLVSALSNLKGDHDVNSDDGHITVDWASASHPVIRCTGCKAADADGDSYTPPPSAWELVISEPGTEVANDDGTTTTTDAYSYSLNNCYYNRGGITMSAGRLDVDTSAVTSSSGVIAVKFNLVGSDEDGKVSAAIYAELSDVTALQRDVNLYVVPLYVLRSETEYVDLRTAVQLQVFETLI